MPFGDRTGPYGMGPRTGRGAGFCAGYDRPGYATIGPGWGGGMTWGRGRGRGGGNRWRHWYHATGLPYWARGAPTPPAPRWPAAYGAPTPDDEIEMLKSQAEWLRNELEAIQSRIDELGREAA